MPSKQAKRKNTETPGGTINVLATKRKFIFIIIAFSVLAYLPVFNAGFVNWDDEDYVVNNKLIESFSNFNQILTEPVQGNYHPLTMLSLALNYSISGKTPLSYHIFNLLLHIINSILIFYFVLRLSKSGLWMAFIVALLFGIHPLHVESVAWVSERKDLLYAFFFISGMIVYLLYIEERKMVLLFLVFLLFALSLLSKPAAVIFPMALLALDFYKDRLRSAKVYFEKVPFFLLAVLFGLLAMHGQSEAGATELAQTFSLPNRLLFASYGIMMYLVKTIWPLQLCTFYPFPEVSNSLPVMYYFSLLFLALLIYVLIKSYKNNRLVAFALIFYLINLALVLQLLPVGNAIIADRYSYLPLVGIFIIPGFYFQRWIDKNNGKLSFIMLLILLLSSAALVTLSYQQSTTWKNGATLWDHAIKISPSSRAYVNRGLLYKKSGNMEQAFNCYNRAIELGTKEPDAWVNRGNVYFSRKQYELAIQDYNQCLALSAINLKAYENRAASYATLGNVEMALADFSRALNLDSTSTSSFANRGMLYMSTARYVEAINDFNHFLKLKADPNGEIWSFSGEANFKIARYEEALNCYSQALQIRETGLYYLNRSKILFQLKRKKEAYTDAMKSIQLGMQPDPAYLKSLNLGIE